MPRRRDAVHSVHARDRRSATLRRIDREHREAMGELMDRGDLAKARCRDLIAVLQRVSPSDDSR